MSTPHLDLLSTSVVHNAVLLALIFYFLFNFIYVLLIGFLCYLNVQAGYE